MKVAVVTPWHVSPEAVGGTERFTLDLATGLHEKKHEVEIFTLSGKSTHIGDIACRSLDLLGGGAVATEYDLRAYAGTAEDSSFYDTWARFLEERIDADDFDTIHLNSFLFAKAWPTKRRVLTIHTNPFEYQLDWGENALTPLEKVMQTDSAEEIKLVTPSAYYGHVFSQMFAREVEVIPHAIDVARLPKSKHAKAQGSAGLHILVPSRLEPIQKRPQVVFEAVAGLAPDVRKAITITASGVDEQYKDNASAMREIAEAGGFTARFKRFRNMAEAYSGADIVALPSRSESFGYAALEALSLEKPTILNAIPTFMEIGEGNPNAHFFKDTAIDFRDVLRRVIEDTTPKTAEPTWSERYDIDRWVGTYEELLGASL